jgi:hypothetical protein
MNVVAKKGPLVLKELKETLLWLPIISNFGVGLGA